jgi:uncharacterized coiled-coil protein SlyX|tara:strand:- start:269 stop:496 length:228 start_codon:yes stop_codon:yes gene_type:complete
MTESSKYFDEKIRLLEERIAFQEDILQKVDDAAGDQQKQIIGLEKQLKYLLGQFRKLESISSDEGSSEEQKPPHY